MDEEFAKFPLWDGSWSHDRSLCVCNLPDGGSRVVPRGFFMNYNRLALRAKKPVLAETIRPENA